MTKKDPECSPSAPLEPERIQIVMIRHGVMISESGTALERKRCDPDHSMNNGIIESQRGADKIDMASLLRLVSPARFHRPTPFMRDGRSDSYPHLT
jgi:hypothetical protein